MAGTLVVGDVIRSARDASPTFDVRQHPDPVLLRALSRYQRELLARIIRLDPSRGVVSLDTALPLADFDAGIAVAAYKYPLGAEATTTGETTAHPVNIVAYRDRMNYRHAVYLLNGRLYLTGDAEDWVPFASVRFSYVPEPSALAMAMTTVLTLLPDAAEPCLVAYLASLMATRGGAPEGMSPPDPALHRAQWREAEELFLDEIGRCTQAVTSQVRETF